MDEFDERQRFETLLRQVEIEGEPREELMMQRVVGFYIGLVLGVPIPLAALMLNAARRDVRPALLVACLALLVFGAVSSALVGAVCGPRVARWLEERQARRRK